MGALNFWTSTGIATLIATLATLLWALWLDRRHRPQALFLVRGGRATTADDDPKLRGQRYFDVTFMNVGDDTAFAVRVEGVECNASEPTGKALVVSPGETIRVHADCHKDALDSARINIEWACRPTRLRHWLRQTERLAQLDLSSTTATSRRLTRPKRIRRLSPARDRSR